MGFWIKIFKKLIYLFNCHCSFITLADDHTTDREIFRNIQTGPFLNLNRSVDFVHVPHWIAIHFPIHYLPFKNFAVCRIQEFPQFRSAQCACCSFSITCVLAEHSWIPLELSLLRLFSVVCLRLYILTEKVSLSKKWKSSPLF